MLRGIELVDVIDEQMLCGEFFQVNDHALGVQYMSPLRLKNMRRSVSTNLPVSVGDTVSANAAHAL